MFGRLLLALDGSALAEHALRHVEALAAECGSAVTLLRVLEIERRPPGYAEDILDWDFRRFEAAAYLARLVERLGARGVHAVAAIEEGDAAERILDQVAARAADLLVLTSHGHGGVTDFVVSGTARKVLSRSPVSVLLVPSGGAPAEPADAPLYRTVVALVDCSRRGESAVNFAARVARATAAELVLVHVVPVPELTARLPLEAEDLALIERVVLCNQRAAERYLAETRARVSAPGRPVRVHSLVARDVARALTDFLAQERPDLVVTCAHGSTDDPDRMFGTVARSLLNGARFPLLVVQDARARHVGDRIREEPQHATNGRQATIRGR